jgi:DNA/RNA-binding domain of Phe-tRNA-synthetase-like protein
MYNVPSLMRLRYTVDPEFSALGFSSPVVCELYGISIRDTIEDLEKLKEQTARMILSTQDGKPTIDPILDSYRTQVAAIGRSPKRFPPAAEKLLQFIRRTGRFPRINTAVDAYNITVCHTGLALGVHDLDRLGQTVTFHRCKGGVAFRVVGSEFVSQTARGDYVYSDETRVLAWLDSKDSDDVKLCAETQNALIVIQGTAITSRSYTHDAIEDAARRIITFCGGNFEIEEIQIGQ